MAGKKILLANDHVEGIRYYDAYRQHGGYTSVEKALKMTPDDIVEEVKKSGLRGRGGAGFPTGMKWSFLAKPEGVPRYLLCNADESEPGTFKDRYLMEHMPHSLVEGMIVSSFALGANTSYIYIRGEYMWIVSILEEAIAEAYKNGWLGKNIQGSGYDLDLYVNPGAGAYICGEETALIESLEGKRGNPRMKPPFPAIKGLWGCPTVVNNVETIATVPHIINMGGDAYAGIGLGRSTGTKLISACGNIRKPGVYEIEMGITVEEFIYSDEYCGGMLPGHKVTAEIAAARGVPIGEDCISPAAHSAFSTPIEMLQFLDRLRSLSGGKPVGFKLCIGHPWEWFAIVKAMVATDLLPDFIVVDGAEGGTGAAP
ncbi:MAG: hypothetical protein EBS30_18500, partial [Planctomycetes bacterium]|nr:hypothetical protein [Planctomycetota bacterium]